MFAMQSAIFVMQCWLNTVLLPEHPTACSPNTIQPAVQCVLSDGGHLSLSLSLSLLCAVVMCMGVFRRSECACLGDFCRMGSCTTDFNSAYPFIPFLPALSWNRTSSWAFFADACAVTPSLQQVCPVLSAQQVLKLMEVYTTDGIDQTGMAPHPICVHSTHAHGALTQSAACPTYQLFMATAVNIAILDSNGGSEIRKYGRRLIDTFSRFVLCAL